MMKNDYTIMEDYCRLNSLKYNIENYSLINMREFKEITLWSNYLTYGISFGIANKILKQIKDINIDNDIFKMLNDQIFECFINTDDYDVYKISNLDNGYLKTY